MDPLHPEIGPLRSIGEERKEAEEAARDGEMAEGGAKEGAVTKHIVTSPPEG
jgi:hypothetical protein